MNILILAAGTRNKIVQYFKRTFDGVGSVIATDAGKLGPAIYDADKYYIVPPITEPGYIDKILEICQKEQISGVLSLIDPELSLLAANEDKFKAIGTTIIGSSYELCEMALDKMQMYEWLKNHGYYCARSWIDCGDLIRDNLMNNEQVANQHYYKHALKEAIVQGDRCAIDEYYDKFWGGNMVRTPDEIRAILEGNCEIIAKSNGYPAQFRKAREKLLHKWKYEEPNKYEIFMQ